MSDQGGSGRMPLSRRRLLQALGGGAGIAAATSALDTDGDDGNLYGGTMALSKAYNVAGKLWQGPDSAKSNVDPNAGRRYIATDYDVEYYGDGNSWILQGVGSNSQSVPAVHTDQAHTKGVPWHDVTTYGATGDGSTVDTTEIQSALDAANNEGGAVVYLPPGTYLIDDELQIGSNTILFGAGIGVSTLKLKAGTTVSGINWGNSEAFRDRQPLLTLKGRGSSRGTITKHVTIGYLTIDWNNGDTDSDKSPAPLWLDSGDDIHVHDIEILNAESSNFDSSTDSSRGHALSITQSHDVFVERAWVGSANYRSIGVGAEFESVHIDDCVVETSNQWRHAIEIFQLSADFALPEGATVSNCHIIVDASRGQQDGITIHGGKDVTIRNNRIVLTDTTSDFNMLVKVFDNVEDFRVDNNTITTDGSVPDNADGIVIAQNTSGRSPVTRGTITGNHIHGNINTGIKIVADAVSDKIQIANNPMADGEVSTEHSIDLSSENLQNVAVTNRVYTGSVDPVLAPEDYDVWFDFDSGSFFVGENTAWKPQPSESKLGANGASRWTMNEGSGSTVGDDIGSNDGSITGASWVTGSGGKGDAYLDFSGQSNAWVDCGSVFGSETEFTVAFWCKPDGSSSAYLWTQNVGSGALLWQPQGGTIQANVSGNTSSSLSVNTGNWHLVALRYKSGTANLRVYEAGGGLVGEDSWSTSDPSWGTASFAIGNRPAQDRPWDAVIDFGLMSTSQEPIWRLDNHYNTTVEYYL